MNFLFFFIITLSATLISKDLKNKTEFIVWNIGQGQWTTLLTDSYCDHFDMGGEFNLSKKVNSICGNRDHRVHLSHWDSDHIGLLAKFRKINHRLCLYNWPKGQTSAHKRAILEGLPMCRLEDKNYLITYSGSTNPKATTNETSEVVATHGILIPGDSPKKEEKKWCHEASLLQIKGLVLGHHGSRSSTSEPLLQHLPKLLWAVATARKKRYGHPHPETLTRLKKHKTPILKTEDWGSIIIRLN